MTIENLKKIKIPDSPGVYFFKKGKKILYIGKATSLRDRVRSYFSGNILVSRGQLILKMLNEANAVDSIKTDSVLEALILEARLIKKYQPPYNTKEKDDKSFNYVVITKEDFPRILIIRGKDLEKKRSLYDIKYLFGPFPHGVIFKDAMKIIRKLFPFRDTCAPAPAVGLGKPCFNRQIGLCPGVCSGEVSKAKYGRTINRIKLFFEGKKSSLIKTLESEMKRYAKEKKFEEAEKVKKTIFALNHIHDIALIKDELKSRQGRPLPENFRIEAYDTAHTSGANAVGVMVVVEDGELKSADYRKFNISDENAGNDISALEEVLDRRFKHIEWPNPRLIVVDGGKAQYNVARKVLDKYSYNITIAAVVKDEKHKPKNILGDANIKMQYEKEILLANSEAHRFALSFHRKKRSL